MSIEEIIEVYNRYIQEERNFLNIKDSSKLIIHKNISINTSFKAVKTFEIILYLLKDNKTYEVGTVSLTRKSTIEEHNKYIKEAELKLVEILISIVQIDMFRNIIDGTFKGTETI